MNDKEKLGLLRQTPPPDCDLVDYYRDLLETVGSIKTDYCKYMTTAPVDCDIELERLPTADFNLCCALLTMLFREDYFSGWGCFDRRCQHGDVQRIIDRMIAILQAQEL